MTLTSDVQPKGWRTEFRRPPIWLIVLLILPLVGVLAFAVFQPIQVLPRISLAPGFSLIDQNGNRLTSEDLRGSFVLYNFTYTNCGEDCADVGPGIKALQDELSAMETNGVPIEFVTIAFDPEMDTPEQLSAYADQLGADQSNWHFATGKPDHLKNVIGGGFSTFYEQRADGSYEYYPAVALVDGWGILRAKYRTATPDPEIVRRDINLLTGELANQDGPSRVAYEAAHLFLCYPDY